MPRFAIAVALAILSSPPAGANHEVVEPPRNARWVRFEAFPCAVACAYWVDVANADLDGDQEPEVFFDECAAPFPPGSWDDVVVKAPGNAEFLIVGVYPTVDWDVFICGPNGEKYIHGHNLIGHPPCNNWLPPPNVGLAGCTEFLKIRATPGTTYVLRAFNWSDPLPLDGWYAFTEARGS